MRPGEFVELLISEAKDKLAVQHSAAVARFSFDLVESTQALSFAAGNKIDIKINIDSGECWVEQLGATAVLSFNVKLQRSYASSWAPFLETF